MPTRTEPRPRRPDPEPLEVDAVVVLAVGTALWAAAFLVLLPLKATLARHDAGWWLWVCVAGVGVGLIGMWLAARRRTALRARADGAAAVSPGRPRRRGPRH